MDIVSTTTIAIVFFVILLLIAIGFFIRFSFRIVPQGEKWTIERFGKYTDTLDAGLHFIIPLIDKVGAEVNMREQVIDIPPQDGITKDNVVINADAVAFYKITDPEKATYNVDDLESGIVNLAITTIRSVIGSDSLDNVLGNREDIKDQLLAYIAQETQDWGVEVTRVEIRDLQPSPEIVAAMAKQLKAERERRAEIITAEGAREAAVLRAEGMKQASFLEAEARKRQAEVEAEAAREMQKVVAESDGNASAMNYFVAQRYVDALKDVASANNSKLIMMPLESTNMASSVAGLTEMLKNIQSDTKR